MINVGIVTSPLSTGHAARGVGFYTKNLLENLKQQSADFGIDIIEVITPKQLGAKSLDILHYPYFDIFSPEAPHGHGVKMVITVHDVIPLEFPQVYRPGLRGTMRVLRNKRALKTASAVLTDSHASVLAIHKHLDVPHEKLKLIYLAAAGHFRPIRDKKRLARIQKKYALPGVFVLYVGDVNWNKNIPGLIRACRIAHLPLVWVGKEALELENLNSHHPELAHTADILQLIDTSVQRLGFVPDEDLVGIYNLAHVYCQASYAEGFGLPVLEALACGTPVAISKTHSLPEIAGECATYFDPYNIDSIATGLREAKKVDASDQLRKFSWVKTARETLQVYIDVLAKS